MGACEYGTYGFGKTADEAYRSACDEARRENGHQEGYSGDIQTSCGFKMGSTDGLRWTSFMKKMNELSVANYTRRDEFISEAKRTKAEAKWSSAKIHFRDMVKLADEKHGPALCVEVTGKVATDMKLDRFGKGNGHGMKVFYFTGTASC